MNIQFSANSTTMLLTALHYTSICSYATKLLLCSILCQHNFPRPADSATWNEVMPLILRASNTTRFSSRSSNFLQFHHKNTTETISEIQNLPRGVCLQIPLAEALCALLSYTWTLLFKILDPPLLSPSSWLWNASCPWKWYHWEHPGYQHVGRCSDSLQVQSRVCSSWEDGCYLYVTRWSIRSGYLDTRPYWPCV